MIQINTAVGHGEGQSVTSFQDANETMAIKNLEEFVSLESQILEEVQKGEGLKAQHEVSLASLLTSFCFGKG